MLAASRSAPRRAGATSTSAASATAAEAAARRKRGILWQATFEPGDLSEWLSDGNGGIYMDTLATARRREPGRRAHRGSTSGIATFAPVTVTSFSYLYREQPSPPEAYYGAWFFIPAATQVRILAEPAPLRLPPHRRRGGDHAALRLQRLPGPPTAP